MDDREYMLRVRSMEQKLYRLPLVLHYLEGYSVNEIEDMLRISASKTTSRLHAARQKLKKLLDGGAE